MRSLVYALLLAIEKALSSSTNPLFDILSNINAIATSIIALLVLFQNKRFKEANEKLQLLLQDREIVTERFTEIYSIYRKISEVFSYFAANDPIYDLQIGEIDKIEKHKTKIIDFDEEL